MKLISDKTRILISLFRPQRRKPNHRHAISESDKNMYYRPTVSPYVHLFGIKKARIAHLLAWFYQIAFVNPIS